MATEGLPPILANKNAMPQLSKDAHLLLSSLPVAACVVDSFGRIVGLNLEGENLLEWSETSCFGKSLHDLIGCTLPDDTGATLSCPILHVLCSGLPIQAPQMRIRTRSGTLRPVEYRCAPFGDINTPYAIVTWREVSQQLEMESDLHRLASIPEESPNPIVEFDQNTTLLYANPAMMDLIGQFGFNEEAFPAILPPHLTEIVRECLQTGVARGGLLATQDRASYEWTFFPVPHTSLVRGYGINLTERLRMEEELRQAKETAEAANRVKSEFLATVSHELRTPLNGVLGMVDLLLGTSLTPDQQEYTEIARHSAADLLNLVNDLLDFSQLEAGKLKLTHSDFYLRDLIRQTLTLFTVEADKKKLALRCELAPDLPAFVRGDFRHLQQVLVNLIGNAVKFTDRGEIVLKVQSAKYQAPSQPLTSLTLNLEPETLNQVVLRFSVQDTGIGIPENRQDRLFQVFSQVDGSSTRKYGGTGLGLALSKQLVECMGGSIGVESKAGQGSLFWFTIPLERPALQPPLEAEQAIPCEAPVPNKKEEQPIPITEPSSSGRSVRLLLVEDNLINQKLAVRLLKKLGYEVDVASNGYEALAALNDHTYAAIVMDCQMPEMDGFEATREIRRREAQLPVFSNRSPTEPIPTTTRELTGSWQPAPVHIPIIALTANAVQGDRERCLEAGMDDYLTKPINPTELKKALEKWLSHRLTGGPE